MKPIFPDGWYQVGTPEADMIGFTKDKFWGNFSKEGNKIFIQYIGSYHRNQGNVQRLYKDLMNDGWDLYIVRPCLEMQHICNKLGLIEEIKTDVQGRFTSIYYEPCWRKPDTITKIKMMWRKLCQKLR